MIMHGEQIQGKQISPVKKNILHWWVTIILLIDANSGSCSYEYPVEMTAATLYSVPLMDILSLAWNINGTTCMNFQSIAHDYLSWIGIWNTFQMRQP